MALVSNNQQAESILKRISLELESEILANAESLIQETVKSFEKELRQKVASAAVVHAKKIMQIEQHLDQLIIRIDMKET